MGISLKQLTDTISLVKEYCVSKFTHDNIKVLNKLSESDNGKILYDNKEIEATLLIESTGQVIDSQDLEDTPVGHIISHIGTTAPKHYLICDGSEYNITDYPYLAQHIQNSFNIVNYFGGDGVNTFAVPSLSNLSINWYDTNAISSAVSASSFYDARYDASKAIDGNTSTCWESEKDGKAPAWWMIELQNKIPISTIKMYQSSLTSKDFTIQGSNDGIDFVDLYDVTNADNTDKWIEYDLRRIYYYKYYRIYCKTTYYNQWFVAQIGEIQFGVYEKINCVKYEPTYFMVKNNTNYLQPTLYSEEERCIGSWIDGKPLYEKVFTNLYTGNVTASTYIKINDTLFNIDKVVNITCITIGNNGNNQEQNWYLKARYDATINGLTLHGSTNYDKVISVNVIAQYTKTTDTENSFTQNMITDFIIQGSEEVLTQEQIQTAINEDVF